MANGSIRLLCSELTKTERALNPDIVLIQSGRPLGQFSCLGEPSHWVITPAEYDATGQTERKKRENLYVVGIELKPFSKKS